MNVKIYLTADIHIGKTFAAHSEARDFLCAARRDVLARMVETANDGGCDVFIVAGDLFDRQKVSKEDIAFAARTISGFEGSFALVLPGNHDYYVTQSQSDLWRRFDDYNTSATVLHSAKPLVLGGLEQDIAVYPSPCHAKWGTEDPTSWMADVGRVESAACHIGLAHGSVEGVSMDTEGVYYPMKRTELADRRMNAWFMGHSHSYSETKLPGGVPVLYPGTPEPDGFECSHTGQAILAEVASDGSVRHEAVHTGRYSFLHETLTCGPDTDLMARIDERFPGNHDKKLFKLLLTGRLAPEAIRDVGDAMAALRRRVAYLLWDGSNLRENITPEKIAECYAEGTFPYRLLMELSKDETDAVALERAYELLERVRQ
ncbi:MAG: metallophosphoesterase [Candidatus Methanofastidiosa archaeon]|nr:metallophosphoesterase [Candidatus Methanofastidiosa archaeon]